MVPIFLLIFSLYLPKLDSILRMSLGGMARVAPPNFCARIFVRWSSRHFSSNLGQHGNSKHISSHSSTSKKIDCESKPTAIIVPSGLCAIWKPKNWTSNDAVLKIRNILSTEVRSRTGVRACKVPVGHGGTLDPLAEGVLVLGIGSGTKLLSSYLSGSKSYRAVAQLGFETDTQDITGAKIIESDYSSIRVDDIRSALAQFSGNIMQTPPMFSALKKDGKRLYDLARQGVTVERIARPVTIYNISLTDDCTLPKFGLDVECSGGVYIRTLITDVARAAGTVGTMIELTRTKQGPFSSSDCLHLENCDFNSICEHIKKCSVLIQ